jgi:hypothetical protein
VWTNEMLLRVFGVVMLLITSARARLPVKCNIADAVSPLRRDLSPAAS